MTYTKRYDRIQKKEFFYEFGNEKSSSTKDKKAIYKTDGKRTLIDVYFKDCGDYDKTYEYKVLTKFRDEYMMATSRGKSRVKRYYEIAPKIVEAIEKSDKERICFLYVYQALRRCVSLCEEGIYEYVEMEFRYLVKNLKKEFNL